MLLTLALLVLPACPGSDDESGNGPVGATGPAEMSASASPAAEEASPSPSPAGEAEEASDLSGTWTGTWANSTPDQSTGTFELEWDQQGDRLVGQITIAGTPCLSGGEIAGEVNGLEIEFGVVSGQVEVAYSGVWDGEIRMSGSYSTSCGNAEGVWEATQA